MGRVEDKVAGQLWLLEALHEDERVHALKLACEWGPCWQHLPRPEPPNREATMLLISHGALRKVAWLSDGDLEAAGRSDEEQAGAQRRLRSRVGLMVEELASKLLADSDVA